MLQRISLTDGWRFRQVNARGSTSRVSADLGQWRSAVVPGCVHQDLLAHDLIPDPFFGNNEQALKWIDETDWEYELTFTITEDQLAAGNLDLVADGLDTLAVLTLNGELLDETENQFRQYRWEIKDRLKPGENTLHIRFKSVWPYIEERRWQCPEMEPLGNKWGNAVIRKSPSNFGWDWGPRLTTCGVWQPIYLETWTTDRLTQVEVHQEVLEDLAIIDLNIATWRTDHIYEEEDAEELAVDVAARLEKDGKIVAAPENEEGRIFVDDPELWWPTGYGDQPLYTLVVELLDSESGEVLDRQERRIGFRNIRLVQERDRHGISFVFEINGVRIFAKGANWIPVHQFSAGAVREDYAGLLQSAIDANMNMVRVWGGGIYEHEAFYDLCDEMGLLVWQDFMFACAIYPGAPDFFANVKKEAAQQVARLHHRACIATWCGNNELEMIFGHNLLQDDPVIRDDYFRLFGDEPAGLLKSALPAGGNYIRSSPFSLSLTEEGANGGLSGDTHFWAVWHARHPVREYETHQTRFCSEFGMQSYPHIELARRFCPEGDLNIFSPAFENHQKNGGGNATIFHYTSQRFRLAKNHEALTYLSQVNQAWCIKFGIEAFRRSMPRTMGALYWQLNDVWPVSSWSSIDHGGTWKALQYAARRFYAPALVTAQVPGEVAIDKINVAHNSIRQVIPHVVYEGLEPDSGTVRWTLFHLDGRTLREGEFSADLEHNRVVKFQPLIFDEETCEHGHENLVLRLALETQAGLRSENTVYFSLPRRMEMPENQVEFDVGENDDGDYVLTLSAQVFQPDVYISLPGRIDYHLSDNFFDLFPHSPKEAVITFSTQETRPTIEEISETLQIWTLTDAYMV